MKSFDKPRREMRRGFFSTCFLQLFSCRCIIKMIQSCCKLPKAHDACLELDQSVGPSCLMSANWWGWWKIADVSPNDKRRKRFLLLLQIINNAARTLTVMQNLEHLLENLNFSFESNYRTSSCKQNFTPRKSIRLHSNTNKANIPHLF